MGQCSFSLWRKDGIIFEKFITYYFNLMKKLTFIAIAICSILFVSCNKEKTVTTNETDGLKLLKVISNDTNTVELYTRNGKLLEGYNDIFLRIKDKATGVYKTDATINWMPIMHMTSMMHSAPKSPISKVAGMQTLYKGYIVFQMPENPSEKWTLSLAWQSGGLASGLMDTVPVNISDKKRVVVFTGSDAQRYILAYTTPAVPTVAVNDFTVCLFKKETMLSFLAVTDATILFDPRMTGMGNHSSPNNVQPIFSATDNLYHGKLSLTMTGYWKLNFIVKDATNAVLKGEEVTTSNESSSLYLELEF